ncbi:hypothetical protein BDZ89DRAFT_1060616 [Hymenopellis radicata]|nr:hypothetical protein BDZ89DRAFT_1060616 [Hymenopellis radicata]
MDTLAPLSDAEEQFSDFPWVVNSVPTGHAPTPNAVRPADADNLIWKLPSPPPPRHPRYGNRRALALPLERRRTWLTQVTQKNFSNKLQAKNIRPAPPRAILAAELIQRAWIKAVRFDVSVIVFDCGNFLRIGIRQRETQTLFLSSLIDVGDPASKYGRLMLGLHLCILHDVLARLPHSQPSADNESESAPSSTTSLKRSADHLPQESPPKRGRTTEPGAERSRRPSITSRSSRLQDRITPAKSTRSDKKNFPSDLRIRTRGYFESHPVLALYLRFHNYNSPTPEVLLSPDHPRSKIYKAATCVPLILTSKLGHGATGQAYTAILGPGSLVPPHEYDVYCHLQSAGVLGIPYIFGYYQDNLRGMGALVMHDVGNPLGRRMDSNKKIKLSANERASLKKILKAIHAKGVLHRDLRSWNMMCNQHGEVSIIDFDRASLKASKEEFSQETVLLARFLKGEFVDRDSVIGSHDMPSDILERIANRKES